MKPEDAIELPVPMDLCEVSYEEARRIIEGGIKYRERPFVLKVSNITARFTDCNILVVPDYAVDEWSLRYEDDMHTSEVWSPGAG